MLTMEVICVVSNDTSLLLVDVVFVFSYKMIRLAFNFL